MIATFAQLTDAQVLALLAAGNAPGANVTAAFVAAGGATQATATAVTSGLSIVNSGNANGGIVLEAAIAQCEIRNRTGQPIQIFPPPGEQLDATGAPNLPVTMQNGDNASFIRMATATPVTWYF